MDRRSTTATCRVSLAACRIPRAARVAGSLRPAAPQHRPRSPGAGATVRLEPGHTRHATKSARHSGPETPLHSTFPRDCSGYDSHKLRVWASAKTRPLHYGAFQSGETGSAARKERRRLRVFSTALLKHRSLPPQKNAPVSRDGTPPAAVGIPFRPTGAGTGRAILSFAPFGRWQAGPAKPTVLMLPRLWFCLANPSPAQVPLCIVPPHRRHPLRRTPGDRSPPSPRVPARRPGLLSITAACAWEGGFTVTVPATPTLRARWGQAPRQLAGILPAIGLHFAALLSGAREPSQNPHTGD